jgi:hypothetical protein
MTPDGLLDALRHFQVPIHEHAGWRTRNHGALTPANVIVVHDTVTGTMSDERAADFCAAGRSDLQGPLYECLVGHDGTAHLIAYGVSWNAGTGNRARFELAAAGKMPLNVELGRPGADDYKGANQRAHAVACITYGAGPYSPEQFEASARVCAAYVTAEGWGQYGATSTIGHGEFSSRKIDPAFDMGQLRTRAQALVLGTGEVWHVVMAGETLWSISRRYGVPVDQIKQLNNLKSDLIGIGWRLRVE